MQRKHLAVLPVNTDYACNLLNYFYSQNCLQQLNPDMSVIRHCQIFQYIEREHCREAVQFIRGLREDKSLQERSIRYSHVQESEWYLQDWYDWNRQKIDSFLGELWRNSWVNMHLFLFHPIVWPNAEIHNYWYAVPTLAFLPSIWWGQGRGHTSVIENALDRLSSALVITQVRGWPQEKGKLISMSSFSCADPLHAWYGWCPRWAFCAAKGNK